MRERDHEILREILETRGDFGHREHVQLAWAYLREYPLDTAAQVMARAIRHLARQHGAPGKYHETITRAWVHCVAVHSQRWGAASFEDFIERNPDLLDAKLLEHFYSLELIGSQPARAAWTPPDLRALPALA
jgi:hypothetical protein